MKNKVAVVLLIASCAALVYILNSGIKGSIETDKHNDVLKEKCIVLKYKDDAETFLKMDCQKFVDYNSNKDK